MKKILLLVLCALTTMGARAQDVEVTYPVITGLGSDKFIITVNFQYGNSRPIGC